MHRLALLAPARWAVLGLARCATAVAAPDPREQRLEALLVALEGLAQRLDGARPARGTLGDRLWAVDRRVVALEQRLGLPPDTRTGGPGLDGLLARADRLGHRIKAVMLAKAAAAAPPQTVPQEALFVAKPPDPQQAAPPVPAAPTGPSAKKDIPWPQTLRFKATGKVPYESTGEWLLGPKHHSSWAPDFLQTGYAGSLSLTLRAEGLLREVKTADLRVVWSVGQPFVQGEGGLRVLDMTWKADRALNNGSKKTWTTADPLRIAGPYRWIDAPLKAEDAVDVEAHVRSLTLHDGTVFHFVAPEYVPKK